MKINSLKIHNFKIFDDVEIDFRENTANVFCGKTDLARPLSLMPWNCCLLGGLNVMPIG